MASRGLSFEQAATLGAVYSAVLILAEVPTGAFADRIGRRRSMMLGALAMVGSSFVSYGAHSMATFGLAECLAAVSMSLCSGADSAYLFDFLQDRGAAHEYARRESVASAAHLVGAGVACALGGSSPTSIWPCRTWRPPGSRAPPSIVSLFLHDDPPRAATHRPARHSARSMPRLDPPHGRRGARRRPLGPAGLAGRLFGGRVRAAPGRPSTSTSPTSTPESFSLPAIGLVFAGVYLVGAADRRAHRPLRRRFGDEVLLWALLGTPGRQLPAADRGLGAVGGRADRRPGVRDRPVLAAGQAAAQPRDRRLVRRATVLSVESIARRGAMTVFLPLAGLAGAASALTLCGVLGLGGLVVLALLAGGRSPGLRGAPTVD